MRVLIQGAGPAGLALALALRRRGIDATVVERARPGRSEGFAVGLRPMGWDAAESLGLLEGFKARAMPLGPAEYRTNEGRPHLRYDYRKIDAALGGKVMAILRDDVQAVMEAAAAGIEIRYGVQIAALEESADGVEARLSDGSHLAADLVVGADGYRSGLRRLHFGPDTDYIRPLGYRVAAWKAAMALPASVTGLAGPGRQATLYELGGGQVATLFCWQDADETRLDAAAKRQVIAARFGDLPAPVAPAIAGCRDWEAAFVDTVCQIEMPAWHRGRVALLGDAAWCLAFLSGMGTSAALAGAVTLAEALAAAPGPEGFAAWEARMRPAITRMQAMSRQIGGQYVPQSRFGMRLQRLLAPVMMSRLLLPAMAKRMDVPMPPQPAP